jgi:hypothetical protein
MPSGPPTTPSPLTRPTEKGTTVARKLSDDKFARPSYGNAQDVRVGNRTIRVKSEAEAIFAKELDVRIKKGAVEEWQYEPKAFPIPYKYRGADCTDTYTPDFRVLWKDGDGEEVHYEVKRGALEPKYASKIKRFCLEYPQHRLVLVWIGPLPSRGAVRRRYDKLIPLLHKVWNIKK